MAMTAVARPMSTQPQATQNTAPILEFSCLYTHDLRRKAKRWHDGLLRYHTFNRRVMVYDLVRNFIGDTFNQSGVELQAGDELELEKDFALVEVSERTAVVQQDISELNKSRQRKSPKKATKPAPAVSRKTPINTSSALRTPGPPTDRHRSLGAMLGTSRGPLGKAVLPTESPYEERQRLFNSSEERPRKKPRHEPLQTPTNVAKLSERRKQPRLPIETTPTRQMTIDLCSPDAPKTSNNGVNLHRAQAASDEPTHVTEVASQNRPALRVISNAPRRMLLCQQPPSRRSEISASTARGPADPQAEKQATELDAQQLRLRERLARVGARQPQAENCVEEQPARTIARPPPPATLKPVNPTPQLAARATTHIEVPVARPDKSKLKRVVSEPITARAPPPPVPKRIDPLDSGPWSREALDLFDWWPPDRDKSGNMIDKTKTTTMT